MSNEKILNLKHHMCDGCCMWNGIEDVYVNDIGEDVPEGFLFALGAYGENAYIKMKSEETPCMFSVGDGRPRKTYEKIKDILGLDYHISGGATLGYAKKTIMKEIDNDRPVVLGPLDMYHLPYLRMYHVVHIPIHYVLMVGYNLDKNCVYIYDCGRPEMQELSFDELERAWNIEKNAAGDKNGFIRFTISDKPMSMKQMTELSMKRKAKEQLDDKLSFVGINALRKIAKEFSSWKNTMSKKAYRNALVHLPEYWGTVPKIPNKLLGINEPENESMYYRGNLDRLGNLLIELGEKNNLPDWIEAGKLFVQAGTYFEQITQCIIDELCNNKNTLVNIPKLFLSIADVEEKAYRYFI